MQRALTWIASVMIAVGSSVILFVLMTLLWDHWFDGQGLVIGLVLIVIGAAVKVVISEQH